MPTFRHGKNSVVKLDDATNTLQDISAYCSDVAFPKAVDISETTTFGVNDKTYVIGPKDNKITLKGSYDATLDSQVSGLLDALQAGTMTGGVTTASVVYGPAGSTTGFPQYQAECLVSDYEVDGAVGGIVSFVIGLQISGAVTRTTF